MGEVLSTPSPNLLWRRDLIVHNLTPENILIFRLDHINLTEEENEFKWELDPTGVFTVKTHYRGLINQNVPNRNKKLWKLKAPLKIKIFLWYLKRGVILTKDNLAKRNWQGSQHCCFCHENKTVQHLFFDYRLTRMVWATVHAAWGLCKPTNIANLFSGWLNGIPKPYKPLILVGVAALCWSVWLCRNAVIFYNKKSSFLQVIYLTTHWLRMWAILQQSTS